MEYLKLYISILLNILIIQRIDYSNGFFFHKSVNYNGSLEIKFNMYFENNEGLIFYMINSQWHWVNINILEEYINIKSEGKTIQSTLIFICGYETARNRNITFTIRYNDKLTFVKCNNKNEMKLENSNKFTSKTSFNFPKPDPSLLNKLYMFFGNVGPYHQYNNKIFRPRKVEIQGCLVNLQVNNEMIFINKTFRCISKCDDNYCNAGKCIENSMRKVNCDCSQSIYNGLFCNESGIFVKKLDYLVWNTSETFAEFGEFFYIKKLKLSWTTFNNRSYELLSINYTNFHLNISKAGSNLIAKIQSKKPKIICLNIKENSSYYLLIKFSNKQIDFKCNSTRTIISSNNNNNNKNNYSLYITNKNIFTVHLASRNFYGLIDMVYQTNGSNIFWIRPNLLMHTQKLKPIFQPSNNKYSTSAIILSIFILLLLVFLIAIFYSNKQIKMTNSNYQSNPNIYEDHVSIMYRALPSKPELEETDTIIYEIIDNTYVNQLSN